jgi:phage-related protein (TIGR01555 family)
MALPSHGDRIRSAIKGLAQKMRMEAVVDGLVNSISGAGTTRDKGTYSYYAEEPLLDPSEIETLYAFNDLAQVICDKPVEDALRDGFSIKRTNSTPAADRELTRRVLLRWKQLQKGENRFMRGAIWGRAFGGGGLILGVRGAGALKDTEVVGVEFIKDFDRQQMSPNGWYADGRVRTYLYTPVIQGTTNGEAALPLTIHESRVMVFPGARTTHNRRRENEGWDLSILQRVIAVLKSFDAMWSSTDAMFADASQAVFHLQGLIQSLGEDTGKGDVATRLSLMDLWRSTRKAIVMDAGDENGDGREDFKVVERASLGGLDGVQNNYFVRLATAARMPLTVLLGMAPAGMDATGESDMVLYFGTIDVYRQQVLAERIMRIIKFLVQEIEAEDAASEERENPEVEMSADADEPSDEDEGPDGDIWEWEIVWPDLAKPTPLDQATAENMRITSVTGLITSMVATPEEVALSLDEIAPSLQLRLDTKSRERALKAAMAEVENREQGKAQAEMTGEVATTNQIKVEKSKPKPGINGTAGKKTKKSVQRKTVGRSGA